MPRARAPGRWLAARWWVNGPLYNPELVQRSMNQSGHGEGKQQEGQDSPRGMLTDGSELPIANGRSTPE